MLTAEIIMLLLFPQGGNFHPKVGRWGGGGGGGGNKSRGNAGHPLATILGTGEI